MRYWVILVTAALILSLPISYSSQASASNPSNIYNKNPGFVFETVLLNNDSIVKGNYIRPGTGILPENIYSQNNSIFVSYSNGNISIMNASTYGIINNISTGKEIAGFIYDPSIARIVAYGKSGSIYLIDPLNAKLVGEINITLSPVMMVFDSMNNYIYSLNYSGSVNILNSTNFKQIKVFNLSAGDIMYDGYNGEIYVLNFQSVSTSLLIYNGTELVKYINTSAIATAFYFNSKENIIMIPSYNQIYLFNPENDKFLNSIPLPYSDIFFTMYYCGLNGYIYDILYNIGIVEVMNATGTYISSFQIGTLSPDSTEATVYDPITHSILIINSGSDTMSVVALDKYQITFDENNLESGTEWGINFGKIQYLTNGSSISIIVNNGTYNYSVLPVKGYEISVETGNITVNGSSITVQIYYSSKIINFPVYIYETGIGMGEKWEIRIDNFTKTGFQTTTAFYFNFIKLNLPAGNYSYEIESPGYTVVGPYGLNWSYSFINPNSYQPNINSLQNLSQSGVFSVSSNSPNFIAYFKVKTYDVTFAEEGLLPGTYWMVNIGGRTIGSSNSRISFQLPNGSYQYSVYTTGTFSKPVTPFNLTMGYTSNQFKGSFLVNSSNFNENISFTRNSNYHFINFSFLNFPTDDLIVAGTEGFYEYTVVNDTISFMLPDGNHNFYLFYNSTLSYSNPILQKEISLFLSTNCNISIDFNPPENYYPVHISSNIAVKNSSLAILLSNYRTGYQSFIFSSNETGLIYLNNGTFNISAELGSNFSYSATVNYFNESGFPIFNENFGFSNKPLPNITIFSENFSINGTGIFLPMHFSRIYTVTFIESGLSVGTKWYVEFNGVKKYSTGTSISFPSLNGSYNFDIGCYGNYLVRPTNGTITVNQSNINYSVEFVKLLDFSINETGLPEGIEWSVEINGKNYNSTSTSINVPVIPGNYTLIVSCPNGYVLPFKEQNLTITGSVSLTFNFYKLYNITILESGIPNGTAWSITIIGNTTFGEHVNYTFHTNTDRILLSEPAGIYSIVIHLPSNYFGSGSRTILNISKSPVMVEIKVYPNITNYVLYAVLTSVILVIMAALLLRRKKHSR